jgi:HEAT repeat protein
MTLDAEMKASEKKKKAALWKALEQDRTMPERADLEHLSGLLSDDIERIRVVWDNLSLSVRQALTQALIEMAEADFAMDFSAIFRIALKDDNAEVRADAVEGLHEVEDVRLVPVFTDMLHHDPSLEVRVVAAQALAPFVLLGELEKIRPGPFNAAVLALKEAHDKRDEHAEVRRRAMESLSYTSSHEVPEMIAQAYKEGDHPTRCSAVFAMGRSADKIWGKIVRHELHNPDPEMRFEATRACGELQLREAAQEIVDLVEDVDMEIRTMALWALGQIGGNLARRTLQRYIDADSEALQDAARMALQELEFFYGDLATFFGPAEDFDGESDTIWQIPGLTRFEGEDNDSDDGPRDEDEVWS